MTLDLPKPEDTGAKAALLAGALDMGDVILLNGDLGTGKTHFARSVIQALLTTAEDVPSPTFTLVQSYQTAKGDLWHADLYRIGSPFEIEELGLTEAFETAICLIEWPDRLGTLTPPDALSLTLTYGAAEDARRLQAAWTHPKWDEKLVVWHDG